AHQPQVERLDGDQLRARMAVVVVDHASEPSYAVVGVRARAAIDKRSRLVTLDDVAVERAQWAAPPRDEELEAAVTRDLPPLVATIALDRLVVELAAERARFGDRPPRLRNDPPRIFVSTQLAVLVPIDGDAVWRKASERFDRLVNTRALILFDRARRWLYLYVGDTWYRSRSLGGSWRTATLLPSGIEGIRTQLVERALVDLLDAPGSALSRALSVGRVPNIYVSTGPAELLTFDGPPRLEAIADTNLSFVANTDADLLVDGADGRYYALLSGRWFRAHSLDGPWQFVAAGELPRDFARIPPEHEKAGVLAAVPGTDLAAEALVVDEVPDTVTVRVADATLQVRYDGVPLFAPLDGTLLRYAVNSATPVLELTAPLTGDGLYYALADGVWFSAATADGPWRVATSVPGAVYDIPASAPLHFVTYVRVYGGTAEQVRVGYRPGYFGACRSSDGVVVFGSGYEHRPYVGSVWIGRPATYGFAARWQPGLGWTLGGDVGVARAAFRPWWEPAHGAVARADAAAFADERADLYARWAPAIVAPAQPAIDIEVPGGGDDLYAGADGRVYRVRGNAWERYAAEGWQAATATSLQASSGKGLARDELRAFQCEREARQRGQARWELYRVTANAVP
ncbi:MAG: hypothetical protein ACXVDD_14725, partial [Polyangia bacterium]